MKTSTSLFVVSFLFMMQFSNAQGFIEKDIVGRWTVTEVVSTKASNDTQMKVVAGFKNSIFILNADHSFELLTQDKSIYISMLARQLVKAQWQFVDGTDELLVGTPQNHYSILKIQLEHKGNLTQFNLEETGIGLVVQSK
jgi:hypothetical protein